MHVSKLFFIKSVHTIIFFFMTICLFYILYCGITETYNWLLLFAIGAILLEGLALILNNWRCPMTTLAERLGAEKGSVTDMFLPKWMSRHIFRVSPILFAAELVLLVFRYLTEW